MTRSRPDDDEWRSEDIESVAREIQRYLVAHPDASDTPAGVRDWWLAGVGRTLHVDVVRLALDRLVSAGVIERRSVPGGVVYGRVKGGEPQ